MLAPWLDQDLRCAGSSSNSAFRVATLASPWLLPFDFLGIQPTQEVQSEEDGGMESPCRVPNHAWILRKDNGGNTKIPKDAATMRSKDICQSHFREGAGPQKPTFLDVLFNSAWFVRSSNRRARRTTSRV
jgi:hypothetical protein